MRVRDLLNRKHSTVITIEPERDLGAAVRLMMRYGIGGLPVATPAGELVGIVSERDIVRAVDGSMHSIREVSVRLAMRRPAPICSVNDPVQEVMARMTRDRLRHLVVLQDERIVGVISVGDLLKHRLEELETEAGVLRDYVAAHRATI